MPYFALIIMFYHVKIACYHAGMPRGLSAASHPRAGPTRHVSFRAPHQLTGDTSSAGSVDKITPFLRFKLRNKFDKNST